ncbi:endonuclease/exonuclease/phosphatase family protein [Arthrospiribacter ruber]|uniref:Endonuclease/exonuclease/phosphatase family protein n=2 Tax=Arthrospiribacter ruber TaxID=2487934 RepID=A0A951IUF4_9BACT|nr:endonuclease/exonuclease/phosphatase family protein [Arthrospiribacter ruber]
MHVFLLILSCILILATFIPAVKKDHWTFRVFDYPRFQKLLLCLTVLILWPVIGLDNVILYWTFFILLGFSTVFLMYQVFPFTVFSKKMVQDSKYKGNKMLSVMVINVYQHNDSYQKVINLINEEQPDLFVLVETDQKWADQISHFKSDFPYHIEIPKDNTYGMLFYSKIKVKSHSVRYLVEEDVPSIEVVLDCDELGEVTLFALHPAPPVPSENPQSTERDAEILLVGKMVAKMNSPVLVLGDLNDVGWSYTSELFLKISGMLDPRRGRGMFNTFHAKYFFMRWPLDHIFVSRHFTLQKLKVHRYVGSDHFPISGYFTLDPDNNNKGLKATLSEKLEAKEKIRKA